MNETLIENIIILTKTKGVVNGKEFHIDFHKSEGEILQDNEKNVIGVYIPEDGTCKLKTSQDGKELNIKDCSEDYLEKIINVLDRTTVRQAKDREFKPLKVGDNIAYLYRWSKTSTDLAKGKIIRFENNRQPWAVIIENGVEKKKLTSSCLKAY